jgi:hypothetical protein
LFHNYQLDQTIYNNIYTIHNNKALYPYQSDSLFRNYQPHQPISHDIHAVHNNKSLYPHQLDSLFRTCHFRVLMLTRPLLLPLNVLAILPIGGPPAMKSPRSKQFLHCFQRRLRGNSSRGQVDKRTWRQLQSETGIANGDSMMNDARLREIQKKTIRFSLTSKNMKSSTN